jgi:hypothetical protein
MLMFLLHDPDDDWGSEDDAEFRQAWHTAVIAGLTVGVLGMWLLGSMAHPPHQAPPRLVPIHNAPHEVGAPLAP